MRIAVSAWRRTTTHRHDKYPVQRASFRAFHKNTTPVRIQQKGVLLLYTKQEKQHISESRKEHRQHDLGFSDLFHFTGVLRTEVSDLVRGISSMSVQCNACENGCNWLCYSYYQYCWLLFLSYSDVIHERRFQGTLRIWSVQRAKFLMAFHAAI